MNTAMLFMIHVCVSVKNKNQIIRGPERLFTGELIDYSRIVFSDN